MKKFIACVVLLITILPTLAGCTTTAAMDRAPDNNGSLSCVFSADEFHLMSKLPPQKIELRSDTRHLVVTISNMDVYKTMQVGDVIRGKVIDFNPIIKDKGTFTVPRAGYSAPVVSVDGVEYNADDATDFGDKFLVKRMITEGDRYLIVLEKDPRTITIEVSEDIFEGLDVGFVVAGNFHAEPQEFVEVEYFEFWHVDSFYGATAVELQD